MRVIILVFGGFALLATGCHNLQTIRLAPENVSNTALVSEQHEYEKGQVFIWWVDGEQVREKAFGWWGRIELELELEAGVHVIECSFIGGDTYSTENAVLRFVAQPGRKYEVRAQVIREGFWREFGKGFKAAFGGAKGSWVAWIEDRESGDVVAGIRPTGERRFRTQWPEPNPEPSVPEEH